MLALQPIGTEEGIDLAAADLKVAGCMGLRVLIVPDKFKGTLTAVEAAEAMARGWQAARPDDELELLPMSDGGDGFGEVLSRLLGAEQRQVHTVDAAHRPCTAVWWWHSVTQTAILESARVIGLAMLPPGRYHPFELDTAGLGTVLVEAVRHGAQRVLVGIGGSATNDAGFGLANALGWRFWGTDQEPIEAWTQLSRLERIEPPADRLAQVELTVAVDVQNPLLGPTGCTRIYGPQKGLRPADFELAEACLNRLAQVVKQQFGHDFAAEPGAGAAGGLGFGLRCFAGAKLARGFEVFAHLAGLRDRITGSDLVLTGEGALDRSSLMGKGVGEVARLCRELAVGCVALAGLIPEPEQVHGLFSSVHAMVPGLATPHQAMQQPGLWLERLAFQVARQTTVPTEPAS